MTTTDDTTIRARVAAAPRWLVVALAAGIVASLATLTLAPHDRPEPSSSTRIEEDDPRWDCRTMGNRRCEP